MRRRNAARRFSKAALRSAGPLPRDSVASSFERAMAQRRKRQRRLEQAVADGLLPTCDCGRPTQIRRNGATGKPFYGCSGYPDDCRATKPIEDAG